MKIIVAGPRAIKLYSQIEPVLEEFFATDLSLLNITEWVSGGAIGVDKLAENFALRHGIPVRHFLPKYSIFGISAPLKRNTEMAYYGDCLLAIKQKDKESNGTNHMISQAKMLGKPVYIRRLLV